MWLRSCVACMVAGLALVVAGLGVGLNGQWEVVPCGPCEGLDQGRLAVEMSLLGVILASLSTAGVAGLMMRAARPRAAFPRSAPPPPAPPGEGPAVAARRP